MSKEPQAARDAIEHIEREIGQALKVARAADLGALVLLLEKALDEARAFKRAGSS